MPKREDLSLADWRAEISVPATSAAHVDVADDVVDIALGKPATQSSLSNWSTPGEAANAVSGNLCSDFAFHTATEPNPWWAVDLGASLPIEAIVIHNRIAMLQERAARLRVEIAEEPERWTLIHAGYSRFGGPNCGPFTLRLAGDLCGRYVRLSLDDTQALHLAKVQVFVRTEVAVLNAFYSQHKLPFRQGSGRAPYKLAKHPRSRIDQIVGIKVDYSGRFGNLLIQYINVIQLAERTGLKYIQLGRHELFDVKMPFAVNGIVFIPSSEELPPVGLFLSGEFFNSNDFVPVLSPFLVYRPEEEIDTSRVCQTYIIPHILSGIPVDDEWHPEDELTIHLRSGDIFNSDHPVTYGYRQPPLSFYTLVVERMRKAGRIKKVRLVFEDRGNPCIDALASWLSSHDVAYRTQSVSLRHDISALVDAPHLVCGHGTFAYAACRLSRRIRTVHFFAPQLGGSYESMPNIEEVYCVTDSKGEYIKAYEYGRPFGPDDGWRRTPQMYAKMLDYPREALAIERLR